MLRYSIFALLLVAVAGGCSNEQPSASGVSRDPISVRGWIADVEGGAGATTYHTVETEGARKTRLFQQTYVEVVNAPYVSGGVAENGSFLLLDVPPGKVSIVFTAPGAQAARLDIDNVPGNADLYLPALVLKPNGVALANPSEVKARMAARIEKAQPSGTFITIAGIRVPIVDTPIAEMSDRHDYPVPPTQLVPIAKVK